MVGDDHSPSVSTPQKTQFFLGQHTALRGINQIYNKVASFKKYLEILEVELERAGICGEKGLLHDIRPYNPPTKAPYI